MPIETQYVTRSLPLPAGRPVEALILTGFHKGFLKYKQINIL
jgi:hypothetical protein